ncbi:MAG: cation:proton antiporter [Gemmatimonadaceae bacterium]
MSFLFSLAAVIVGAKLLGELARRFGQPPVLGELLAGVILGGNALGLVDPRDPAMHALGELGLFVLIFQIGLHSDVRSLRRVGVPATMVAIAGVVLPFVGGFFAARALGVPVVGATIAAASLTATSMAISARMLGDKGLLRTKEGRVVLGAALTGDVIGLIILSIVVSLAGGTAMSTAGVARATAITVGFTAVALGVGWYAMPPLFRLLSRIRTKGSLGMFAIAFALLVAALAIASGTGAIIGAFVAGTILHPTPQREEIERTASPIGHLLVPVFFAVVGASVDLRALGSRPALEIGAALIVVGVAGKVIAGFAPLNFEGSKLLIGAALVPRGEVGLIFAQMGLAAGAITPELFGAIVLMVVVTTLVAPPLVHAVVRRDDSLDREHAEPRQSRNPEGGRQTTAGRRH